MSHFVIFNTVPITFDRSDQWYDALCLSKAVNQAMTFHFADPAKLDKMISSNPMVAWHVEQKIPLRARAETRSDEEARTVWSIMSFEFSTKQLADEFREKFS